MKHLFSSARYFLTVGAISTLCMLRGYAGEPTSAAELQAAADASATATAAAANKLPYGVEDILKLSRAQVNDDVIVSYIQTSGTVYNLRANDVVYLRGQGVSDRVVTAMLDQRRKPAETTTTQGDAGSQIAQGNGAAAAASQVVAAPAPVNPDPPLFIPGQNAFEIAAYGQPVTTEVDASSTLYVIPFGSSSGPRPVYTFYPGCSYPTYSSTYVSCGYRSYCAPSTVVRIGGGAYHHSGGHSFHRR